MWTGAGATTVGAMVAGIAYPLLVLWLTGSAAKAGLVGFAAALPNFLVQLPAGVLVDRVSRRRLMMACNVVGVLATGSVAVAVALGRVWLPQLMAVAFVEGSLAIVYRLAERAAVRHVVTTEQLGSALTRNEARSRAAGLLGQPLGTVLFTLTRWVPFAAAVLGHLVSMVTLWRVRGDLRDPAGDRHPGGLLGQIGEGLAWTWRQRFLRMAMSLVAGTNIVFQGVTLALFLLLRQEHRPATLVGLVTACAGLGGLAGAMTASLWLRRLRLPVLLVGGMLGWTVLIAAIAVVRNPLLLCLVFAAMALVGGVFNVAGGVYQVRITPDRLQGRVSATLTLIGSGANALGMLAGGFVLDWLGVGGTALGMAGVMALLALVALASRVVRGGGYAHAGPDAHAGPEAPAAPADPAVVTADIATA
ncbi:MAG TPA: MFS transporter [Rugosimonospora sp.]|nr:MFS transporter [Rugosimonospora sp.]